LFLAAGNYQASSNQVINQSGQSLGDAVNYFYSRRSKNFLLQPGAFQPARAIFPDFISLKPVHEVFYGKSLPQRVIHIQGQLVPN